MYFNGINIKNNGLRRGEELHQEVNSMNYINKKGLFCCILLAVIFMHIVGCGPTEKQDKIAIDKIVNAKFEKANNIFVQLGQKNKIVCNNILYSFDSERTSAEVVAEYKWISADSSEMNGQVVYNFKKYKSSDGVCWALVNAVGHPMLTEE